MSKFKQKSKKGANQSHSSLPHPVLSGPIRGSFPHAEAGGIFTTNGTGWNWIQKMEINFWNLLITNGLPNALQQTKSSGTQNTMPQNDFFPLPHPVLSGPIRG